MRKSCVTGRVTTSALLDYDVEPVYELDVIVRDGSATEGRSVTGTLTVSLIYDNVVHTILNLPNAVTVDAKASPAGTQVTHPNHHKLPSATEI